MGEIFRRLQVSPHDYLNRLRDAAVERNVRAWGISTKQSEELIGLLDSDAEELAHTDLNLLASRVPDVARAVECEDVVIEQYVTNFRQYARSMGKLASRLADEELIAVLEDSTMRGEALRALGRDYRRAIMGAIVVPGFSQKSSVRKKQSVPRIALDARYITYYSPEYVQRLRKEFFSVGNGYVQYALTHNPLDPRGALEKAELDYLHFLKSPKYSVLGETLIKKAVYTSSKDSENLLRTMLNKYKALMADPEIEKQGSYYILRAVGAHKEPRIFIEKCIEKFKAVRRNKKYNVLTDSALKEVIFNNTRNITKELDRLVTRVDNNEN